MSTSNYTLDQKFIKEVLGLDGAVILDQKKYKDGILLDVRMEGKPHSCPECGCKKTHVHDHRKRVVYAALINGTRVWIRIDRRRFRCTSCEKRFYEEVPFLMRYQRITLSVRNQLFESLGGSTLSVTDLSRFLGLSPACVRRYIDLFSPDSKPLPRVMGIDEFRGNAGGQKYQVILTDLENGEVVDILEGVNSKRLADYFNSRPDRDSVEIISMDLSNLFRSVAKSCFPQAQIVADRFHLHRSVLWSMERVRKSEQKHLGVRFRKFFKHSRKILYKRYENLSDREREALAVMFSYSPSLKRAWMLKESFFSILDLRDEQLVRSALGQWIKVVEDFDEKEFLGNVATIRSWLEPVIASVFSVYSNGFTEGVNNKIKVLKRCAYGVRRLDRFRTRIMLSVNIKRGAKLAV